jgi:hypothetical protein
MTAQSLRTPAAPALPEGAVVDAYVTFVSSARHARKVYGASGTADTSLDPDLRVLLGLRPRGLQPAPSESEVAHDS